MTVSSRYSSLSSSELELTLLDTSDEGCQPYAGGFWEFWGGCAWEGWSFGGNVMLLSGDSLGISPVSMIVSLVFTMEIGEFPTVAEECYITFGWKVWL